jgi:hypothetical protein
MIGPFEMVLGVVAMPFLLILGIIAIMKLAGGRGKGEADEEQVARINQLVQQLDRMEKRLGNLETILIERHEGKKDLDREFETLMRETRKKT